MLSRAIVAISLSGGAAFAQQAAWGQCKITGFDRARTALLTYVHSQAAVLAGLGRQHVYQAMSAHSSSMASSLGMELISDRYRQ